MAKLPGPLREQVAAFARCGQRLARVERRVAALEVRCDERLAARVSLLDELPAAARFHPFAAGPASGGSAAAVDGSAQGRGRGTARRATADGPPQEHAGGQRSGTRQHPLQGDGRRAGQHAEQGGLPAGSRASPSRVASGQTDGREAGAVASTSPGRDFGAVVEQALRRLRLPTAPARDSILGRAAVGSAFGSAFGDALAGLARGSGASANPAGPTVRRHQAGAAQRQGAPTAQPSAGAPALPAAGIGAALRDALSPLAGQPHARALQGLGPLAAAAILRRQLALPGPGAALRTGPTGAPAGSGAEPLPQQGGSVSRARPAEPAPRAPARLLDSGRADGGARNEQRAAATPAAASAGAGDVAADDVVAALNRLLIDQAWLRGVDLR